MDVSSGRVPPCDSALFVAHWLELNQAPAVSARVVPATHLQFEGKTLFEAPVPPFQRSVQILGVNDSSEKVRRREIGRRQSGVLEGPPVLVQHAAIWTQRGNHLGDRIHDPPVFALAGQDSLLSALAFVDVSQQVVPADDASIVASKWKAARLKPAVLPIEPAEAVLPVTQQAGFDGALPCRPEAGQVVGMNNASIVPVLQFLERSAEVLEQLAVGVFDFASGR